jgi:hypothetical protein
MPSKYEKNYTPDGGYMMDYKKGANAGPYKNRVLQFKIELPEILPSIWRRILVPSEYNFWDLHVAIQDSLGWHDSHLHHFVIKGKGKREEARIGIPDFDRVSDEIPAVIPGWEIPVLTYFNDLGVEAKYLYDYGDSWWHTVQLEAYVLRDKEAQYPVSLGGERACPPEDCGGVQRYYRMLKTLADPKSDDYEDMKKWVGEKWKQDAFDKDKIEFWDPYKRWKTAFLEP